ncbi:MAG: stage II sporulation protein M [Desulfuromonadales bacterium]|nr:stage II sporulation protein M [Desulfuromonadales bacterium]
MHTTHFVRAWKWLLAYLFIATSVGYFSTLILSGWGVAKPETILRATTAGIRHVGLPILTQGVSFGIDRGIMIFLCNVTVALLIIAVVYWTRLLNPYNHKKPFLKLRQHLQKDRSAERLRKLPAFAKISSSQLRLTSFLLLVSPFVATIMLGLMAGTLLGTVHKISASPMLAMAYILPHGIPEITALLLACSIPLATWLAIRPVIDNECPASAFRRIDRVVASKPFQQRIKMVVTLLLIAGIIEAHLTIKVVTLFSGG